MPTSPPPPPVVAWYLADILTGDMLAELPLDPGGTIKKLIAKVEQNQFTLPVLDDRTPEDWADLLVAGKTMIVLTLDTVPTQAWIVIDHQAGDVTVPITANTLEECLQRTNVPDLDATLDDALALALLLEPVGTNFGFNVTVEPCGKTSDHLYTALEDRKTLDAAVELMAAEGGPEWRIVIDWTDPTRLSFTKTVEIKKQIGVDRSDAVFDLDENAKGCVDSYRRLTSYAEGFGATSLIGTSEGSGSSRPMTEPKESTLLGEGWPRWEERVNFTGLDGDSVGDEDTELNNRTAAMVPKRERGKTTWFVTGNQFAPRVGTAYGEGDSVHLLIAPQGKLDPLGGTATVRVQGWELDPVSGMGTPQLWDDGDDTDG